MLRARHGNRVPRWRRALRKASDDSLFRRFVRRPQIASRRSRTTHRGEYGIDQYRRSENNPTDIQPNLIHGILLW